MQLATFRPDLATFCPTDPRCPHEAPHAGSHGTVCRPAASEAEVEEAPTPARPTPSRELRARLVAEAREAIAAANRRWAEAEEVDR